MIDWLLENWMVIAPAVAGVVALFFPQLKPFLDAFLKKKPAPSPILPPVDEPADLIVVVQSIQLVIDHFETTGNQDGARLARQVAQSLFAELPTVAVKPKAK